MKEKIKKYLFVLAEIGTVIWAINGMWGVAKPVYKSAGIVFDFGGGLEYNPLILFLFYPLSAVLILYLLRKYDRKN